MSSTITVVPKDSTFKLPEGRFFCFPLHRCQHCRLPDLQIPAEPLRQIVQPQPSPWPFAPTRPTSPCEPRRSWHTRDAPLWNCVPEPPARTSQDNPPSAPVQPTRNGGNGEKPLRYTRSCWRGGKF